MIRDQELRRLGVPDPTIALFGPLLRAGLTMLVLGAIATQSAVYWRIAADTIWTRRMADFGVFYDSAARARASLRPYSAPISGEGRATRPPNLTPPHVVAALMPLSALPPLAALGVWFALSVASAAAAIAITLHEARIHVGARACAIVLAAMLCAAPTGALLFSAQITWLLWGPAAWAWARARHRRWTSAALVLGVLASIKPFLFVFVPVFLIRGRWRAAASMIVSAAACYAAGIAALGWTAFDGWIDALRSVEWAGHVWNGSIFGFVERALHGTPPSAWPLAAAVDSPIAVLPISIAAGALITTVAARAVLRLRDPAAPYGTDRLFAIATTSALLLSPLAWVYYDFLLVSPVIALAAHRAWRTRGRARLLALACAALVMPPGVLTIGQPSPIATVTIGSLYFWALLAVWIASVSEAHDVAGADQHARLEAAAAEHR